MKIVAAPDSFKGSLGAWQACGAIEAGVRRAVGELSCEVLKIPMADGGEGTVSALVHSTGGKLCTACVCGPVGKEVGCAYGILGGVAGGRKAAVLEVAGAAGLTLVAEVERNPLRTTSYGVGELILRALDEGCEEILVGLGGSGTVDCGTGMAQALGVRFFDKAGHEIRQKMSGGLMGRVGRVDVSGLDERVGGCVVRMACDVDNVLLGGDGAVMVYAEQKGADAGQREELEANMGHIIGLIEDSTGRVVRDEAGAGAAGGLGAGGMAFLGGGLEKGVDVVLRACGFREKIQGADLVITGEGRVDSTTVRGKTVCGVARVSREEGVSAAVVAGILGTGWERIYSEGVKEVICMCEKGVPVDESMRRAEGLLAEASERLMKSYFHL